MYINTDECSLFLEFPIDNKLINYLVYCSYIPTHVIEAYYIWKQRIKIKLLNIICIVEFYQILNKENPVFLIVSTWKLNENLVSNIISRCLTLKKQNRLKLNQL